MPSTPAPNTPHPRLVVTGIDTGVGKTLAAALLCQALGGYYWKAVQAGADPLTDRQWMRQYAGLPEQRLLPEAYNLPLPQSPHWAAEQAGVVLDPQRLAPPQPPGPLVVEGAGGVLVPLSRSLLYADLFAQWGLPVVVVVRAYLGAINHTLLTVEALRARGVPILGLLFNQADYPSVQDFAPGYTGLPNLGQIPQLPNITPPSLQELAPQAIQTDRLLARCRSLSAS